MTQTARKKPIIGVLQITVVVVLMAIAFIYSREPDSPATAPMSEKPSSQSANSAPLVSVLRPLVSSEQIWVSSTGSVAVRSYVTLTSQVSGKVIATSTALRNGGSFAPGETLVTLEPRDFTLSLAQAQAEVTSAQAALQLSRAEASIDISSYQRLNPGKEVPALIAKEPQIAQAMSQLQGAIARRDIQQVNLERSVYSLPFAGKVVESSADEGQILNAGQSFGRVYALDAVEIVISLAPQDLAKIAPAVNRVAMISAEGMSFEGRIDRISAERNPRTQFSQVFLSVEKSKLLVPGTFVTVKLRGPTIENTFMLPESAVQVGQIFWTVKGDTIVEVPANIIGRSNGQYVVEAFEYGDGIITGAVPGARDGRKVRMAETN